MTDERPRLIALRRPPLVPPTRAVEIFEFMAGTMERRGGIARHRGLRMFPHWDVYPDDPDCAWFEWHWCHGWIASDEVLIALGHGAFAADHGLPRVANPYPYPPPEGEILCYEHWEFG